MALEGGNRAFVDFQVTPPLGSSIVVEGDSNGPTAPHSPPSLHLVRAVVSSADGSRKLARVGISGVGKRSMGPMRSVER